MEFLLVIQMEKYSFVNSYIRCCHKEYTNLALESNKIAASNFALLRMIYLRLQIKVLLDSIRISFTLSMIW
jgi:hypothetical protein